MAGIAFTIDFDEQRAIDGLHAFLRRLDPRDLLDEAADVVESGARARLEDDQRAPDGTPWAPWSKAYAKRRAGRGALLRRDGHLRDSLTRRVDRDGAEVGSNRIYARVHQLGGGRSAGGIPARPYLGVSPDEHAEIGRIVARWLADAANGADR